MFVTLCSTHRPRVPAASAISAASVSCGAFVVDEATFDGGNLTSDGGVLHLRAVDKAIGLIDRLCGCIADDRHQSYVDHSLSDLLRQRIFQIACGYEDANDCKVIAGVGRGGQLLFILPSRELVITIFAGNYNERRRPFAGERILIRLVNGLSES